MVVGEWVFRNGGGREREREKKVEERTERDEKRVYGT